MGRDSPGPGEGTVIEGGRSRVVARLRDRGLAWWAVPLTWTWLMLLSFLQRVGSTTFDTKFDLTTSPGRFMERSLSLWNQDSSFGELQNQAYGYLFPQGTFFWIGELAGMPDWVVQRAWSGLLLVVAFEGCRRLFLALSPQASSWAGWLGGVAYAVAPRLLGLAGVLSAEVLPTAVLPWVVLPVVLAHQGRCGPRTAALASGAAVLAFGGVNAVENLAALPLALFVVLAGVRRPGGGQLLRWWLAAVAAASAWWMLPLLVLGRYSPPFLDYIETSIAVVRPLGWTNVARGADHWLSFIYVGGQPWWPGAYALSTAAVLIAATALVSALGLWGLTRRSMPLRGPLLLSFLLGAVCLTVSRGGLLASPLHDQFQYLLDGPLSMLRNVHKVDPLLRLPLALGLAHLATSWVPSVGRPRAGARVLAQALTVALLVVVAQPLWSGEQRKPGWEEVPQAWTQATRYLAESASETGGTGSALVVPGSGFGQQWWGWTIDEPIQGLATTPWATRSQVPLTPGSTIRLLDSVQERISDGLGSPELSGLLARAGIEYLVVRRDLDLFASGAPDPARVDLALQRSPELTEVATFGEAGFGLPMISVLRVDREVARVEAVHRDDVETLAGGPEDILTALEAGVLDAETPVVMEGEPGWDDTAPDVVGDGYRKRERGFGRLEDAVSQVMSADEEFRTARAANDYPGPESVERVVASYDGVASVTASSSGGYSDNFGPVRPEVGPYSAVDGLPSTFWQSSPLLEPEGQWLQVDFDEPVDYPRLRVTASVDGVAGVPVRELTVTAGGLVQTVQVDPETGLAEVDLPAEYDSVRVVVSGVAGEDGVVALREVDLDGLTVDRRLVVPAAGDADTAFVLRARPHRRGCIDAGLGTSCGFLGDARPSEEESGLVREITVDEAGSWSLDGSVVARSSASAQRLLEPILQDTRVRASTTYLSEPGVAPQMAFDADPRTFWAAAEGDPRPTLRLRWPRRTTLDSLSVVDPAGSAVGPSGAVLQSGTQRREVDLSSGSAEFEPLTTRWLTITFEPAPAGADAPVGVAELGLPGLEDQRYLLDRQLPTGSVCGLGPEVEVDGQVHPTRVSGVLGDVIDGTPLRLEGCGDPIELDVGAHEVRFRSTDQFAATALTLRPRGAATAPAAERRATTVRSWTTERREVEVGEGPASVLVVPENVNDGWVARLGDDELERVRVDGWKQGYLLPEGDGGVVTLTFAPHRWYQAALGAGGLAAVALLVGAVVLRRRERTRLDPWPAPEGTEEPVRARWRWSGALVVGVLGGPAVLVGYLAGTVARARVVDPGAVGALLVAGAGVAAGVTAAFTAGLPPLVCDAVTALGVGLVASVLTLRVLPAKEVVDG